MSLLLIFLSQKNTRMYRISFGNMMNMVKYIFKKTNNFFFVIFFSFQSINNTEQYYNMVSSYLDKTQRVDVLNKRLGVVEELLEMLRSELHTKNDTKLEWIIIILIVVEVLLEAVDVLLVTVKFED